VVDKPKPSPLNVQNASILQTGFGFSSPGHNLGLLPSLTPGSTPGSGVVLQILGHNAPELTNISPPYPSGATPLSSYPFQGNLPSPSSLPPVTVSPQLGIPDSQMSPIRSPESYASYGSSPGSPGQPATSFAWMFDDRLDKDFTTTPYDRLYQKYVDLYTSRSAARVSYHPPPPPTIISDLLARQIRSVLDPLGEYDSLSPSGFAYYIDGVWDKVESVNCIIHRPSFYAQYQIPELLSCLVVLGMALSQDPHVVNLAKILYTRAFDGVKTALALANSAANETTENFDTDLSLLQAVCILMRFESQIVGGGNSMHSMTNGKWLIERYLWFLIPKTTSLSSRHHREAVRNTPDSTRNLFRYGEIEKSGYRLYDRSIADPVLQWREWAKYEACKRSAHFALYCDCVHTLQDGSFSSQLSIFDIDTHMPCPECLWKASSHEEFLEIVGPSRRIQNVPYLYVIKSMLRFPRLGEETTFALSTSSSPWSLFTLSSILYGLLSIARAMNGSASSQEEVIRKLNTSDPEGLWHVDFYERGIQVRLSRGFDIWTQYFEAATGNSQHAFHMFGNRFENVNIIGQMATETSSAVFLDYILLILLHYHSACILMSEDLKLVLKIANELPDWAQKDPQPVLNHIPLDVYRRWFDTKEAKNLVSISCLFLVRITAGKRLLTRDRAENLLLGVVTYYAVVIVWLHYVCTQGCTGGGDRDAELTCGRGRRFSTDVDDEEMIHNATSYLYRIWGETTGNRPSGTDNDLVMPVPASLSSVIALGAWLLRGVHIGKPQTGGQILHSLNQRLFPDDTNRLEDPMYLF
jgi:hypothetical protein